MPIELSNMAPDTLSSTTSETEVIVYGKSKRAKTKNHIQIPLGFEKSTLFIIYIKYLQSSKFQQLSAPTRRNEANIIGNFFKYIAKNHSKDTIPTTIIHPNYTNHLRKAQVNGNTVAGYINAITKPLRWAKENADESMWDASLIPLLSRVPIFNRCVVSPTPALSQLFPDCPYTDSELIESLRLTTCWFLSICQTQRDLLSKDEVLRNYVKYACQHLDPMHTPFRYLPAHRNEPVTEWARKAYGALVAAICDSENDLLIERMFYSRPLFYKKLDGFTTNFGLDIMSSEIRSWLNSDRDLKTQLVDPKRLVRHSIDTFTLANLVIPGDVENLVMLWMLASERIQSTGVESLKLSDFSFSTQGTQTVFEKHRSVTKQFPSNLYKRNTQIYQTYAHWHLLITKAQPLLANLERRGYFLCACAEKIWDGQLNNSFSGEHLALQLLTVEGSIARQQCMSDIPKAKPFLWLLKRVMVNHLQYRTAVAAYDALRSTATTTVKRSDVVKISTIDLTPAVVAQSRVAMDNPPLNSHEDELVSAMLTSHSVETKKNVYNDRSTTKERIKNAAQFAAQVGERMVVDAKKVANMLHDSEILSLEEARKRLGLKSPAEDLNSILEQLDPNVTIGLFGEFSETGKTLIIADRLTAALIHSYIKHIDNELPRLRNDNEHRAMATLVHQEYLRQILERFPPAIRDEGIIMACDHEFPFPSLV